jgi:hypothetical protein
LENGSATLPMAFQYLPLFPIEEIKVVANGEMKERCG